MSGRSAQRKAFSDSIPIMTATFSRRCFLGFSTCVALAHGGGVPVLSQQRPRQSEEALTPYDFGAVGNGRVDDTGALRRALLGAIASGRVLDLRQGIFRVTGSIAGTGNVRIENSGGAIVRADKGEYLEHAVLALRGTATRMEGLSASPMKGDTILRSASATRFSGGDLAAVYDPRDRSFSGFRPYYRAGEFVEVAESAGGTIKLRAPLRAGYGKADPELYRISPLVGYLDGLIIESAGHAPSLLRIDYARGFRVVAPRLIQANNDCLVISRSVDCLVQHAQIENAGGGTDEYGVVFANCQRCRLEGGTIEAPRHPVAIGGGDYENAVPSRDVVVVDATLRNDPRFGTHCADLHGNTEDCGYERCVIFGGFSAQGRSSYLKNSTVYAMSNGPVVYGAELLGGQHEIYGNTFHFSVDPSVASRGAIDFGGNSDALTRLTTEDLTIVARNNRFNAAAFGPNTMLLYVRNAGSHAKVNVRFVGNELKVNDFAAMVRVRLATGSAKSDFIEVDGNATSLPRRPRVYPDAAYGRFERRLSS